jgi:hypothetical protein
VTVANWPTDPRRVYYRSDREARSIVDFNIGDRVRVCFPEDLRPLRWDSVQGLMDGRRGTIVDCLSGFWVVRFDKPIELVPGSYAEQELKYGPEIEQEPLPATWLRKDGGAGGLLLGVGNGHGLVAPGTSPIEPRPHEPPFFTDHPGRSAGDDFEIRA